MSLVSGRFQTILVVPRTTQKIRLSWLGYEMVSLCWSYLVESLPGNLQPHFRAPTCIIVTQCPIKPISCIRSSSLLGLNLMLLDLHRVRKDCRFWSCVSKYLPCITILSAMRSIPDRPSRAYIIFLWKISGDTFRPNGKRRHLKRPKQIWTVVSRLNPSSNSIFQYPEERSAFKKTRECAMLCNVSSIIGNTLCSRFNAHSSSRWSRHMLISPVLFLAITI